MVATEKEKSITIFYQQREEKASLFQLRILCFPEGQKRILLKNTRANLTFLVFIVVQAW